MHLPKSVADPSADQVYRECHPIPTQNQPVGLQFGGHHFRFPAWSRYYWGMSEEASHAAESPRGLDYRLVVAGVVIVALVALLMLSGPFGSSDTAVASASATDGSAAFDPPPADSEEVTLAMAHAEARAIAMGAVAEAKGLAESVRSSLSECSGLIEQWADLRQALLEDEAGRRVASTERTTRRFLALHDSASPDAARIQLRTLRSRLDSAQGPINNMQSASSNVHAPKGLVETLERLASDADELADLARGQFRALQALVSDTRSSEPAGLSLRESIAIVGGQSAQEHAAEVSRLRAEAERARYEQMQQLEARRKRMIEIASSPEAREHLRVLNILTKTEDTMPLSYVASAYDSASVFYAWCHDQVARALYNRSFSGIPSTHNSYTHVRNLVQELDADARRDFPETDNLWKLFRIFVLSEANQQFFLTNEDLEQFLKDAERSGDSTRIARLKNYMNNGRTPPEPTLP